jgi:hypothetical protein
MEEKCLNVTKFRRDETEQEILQNAQDLIDWPNHIC